MQAKQKIIIPLLAALLVICFSIAGIVKPDSNTSKIDAGSLPIVTIEGSFMFDPSHINEAVGWADYVFVGNVVRNNGTIYKHKITMEDENGKLKEVGTPYTNYEVQVVDNIKGNLKTDEPIELQKHGGVTQDQQSVLLFEDDVLPEVGQTYIFLAYAQPDGSLLIVGPNSNIHVDMASPLNDEGLVGSTEYEKYKDAYENEVIPVQRERFTSKYEI